MYMNYTYITFFESLYLIYMYFFFKTKYNINTALLDKKIQKIGPFFVHNTGANENKICSFGKLMAIIAVILAWIRLRYLQNPNVVIYTILFNTTCVILAFLMNLNALIYIIPLMFTELYVIYTLMKTNKYPVTSKEEE